MGEDSVAKPFQLLQRLLILGIQALKVLLAFGGRRGRISMSNVSSFGKRMAMEPGSTCSRVVISGGISMTQPNVQAHLLPQAGATLERMLEAVRCRPSVRLWRLGLSPMR